MKPLIITAVSASLTLWRASAGVTLDGQRVGLEWRFPNQGDVYATYGTAIVVEPSTEFTGILGAFDLNFSGSQMVMTFLQNNGFGSAGFHGYRVNDSNNAFKFVSVTSSTPGFDASRISFDDHNVFINMDLFGYSTGQQIVFDVTVVPEASTYVAAGLLIFPVAIQTLRQIQRRRIGVQR